MIATAKSQLPQPKDQERPSGYADRIGRFYMDQALPAERRSWGQFFTPVGVADFLAQLCRVTNPNPHILDPGAGAGVLVCAVCEALANRGGTREIHIDAYEIAPQLKEYLEKSLSYLKDWLCRKNIGLSFSIFQQDFVLANAESLAEEGLLFSLPPQSTYDLVIANPPYFKLPKSDPRAQAAESIVSGQPNIYAVFMAVSAALLKTGGEMVCITPRSYTAGGYFRLFREKFFARMQPQALHLFDSRTEAFGRDEVLQENLILRAKRLDGWTATIPDLTVEVSQSAGGADLSERKIRLVPLKEILDWTGKDKVLRLLLADEDDEVLKLVRQWPGSLHHYGLEISTGPVVPFRATQFLSQYGEVPSTHAPLLWMQNVRPMRVEWPVKTRNKTQYIASEPESRQLLVKNSNYVLLRRFSAKEAARRLVAAPYLADKFNTPLVGLENHLNYVHRPKGTMSVEEVYGLSALFNSELADGYFRTFNGNTQVSATELRAFPLPPLALIEKLGQRVFDVGGDLAIIDKLVNEMFRNGQGKANGKD